MLQHDHHCPVYGGCVAKNNTSSFHTMIISAGCYWVYSLGYSIYYMSTTTEDFKRRTNSTGYSDSNYTSGAKITFYLILAEIAAVLIIPIIVSGCKKFKNKNKRTQTAPHVSEKKMQEISEEILLFARENNFPDEEEVQLREILQIEASHTVRDATHHHNDLNHNQVVEV